MRKGEDEELKAAQMEKYSKQIQLEINNIKIPEINNHEVLIKVKAAGVNPLDILILNGSIRMIADYDFPLTLETNYPALLRLLEKML